MTNVETATLPPRMEPGTEFVVNFGGINWCWYQKYKLNTPTWPGDTPWLMPVGESYRLHRFDDRQGAGEHPTETVNATLCDRPDYRIIQAFGMDVIKTWVKRCKAINVRDDECERILIINGHEYPVRVPRR